MVVYCERVEPFKFTNKDALECGEVSVSAFEDDDLNLHVQGDRYRYRFNVESIVDPRDRLSALVRNAKLKVYHTRSWARLTWLNVLDPTLDVYVARESERDDRIIGVAAWKHPQHMQQQLNNELQRTGFKWKCYYYYKQVMVWVEEKLSRKWHYHPFVNTRLFDFHAADQAVHNASEMTVDELIKKNAENSSELGSCHYPKHLMIYLYLLCVHSDFQKRGIGKKLLQLGLDTIPNVPTPITEDIKGPQKFYLEASPAGAPLYSKMGFATIVKNAYNAPPFIIESTFMMMSR